MKRLICILFLLLLLCGCTQSGRSFSLNKDSLNASFQSKIDGNEFRGNISFDDKNNMGVIITYPENIKGFSLYFNDENVLSSVDDVENSHKITDFTDNFAFMSIYTAFRKAITDGVFSENKDSAYEMTFGEVTLNADKQGNITSAKTENSFFIFNNK